MSRPQFVGGDTVAYTVCSGDVVDDDHAGGWWSVGWTSTACLMLGEAFSRTWRNGVDP